MKTGAGTGETAKLILENYGQYYWSGGYKFIYSDMSADPLPAVT
jgi:hypothetical protein